MTAQSEEQSALTDQIDRFLREACEVPVLHKAFDGDGLIADSIWRGMLDLGLGGLAVPEEYDGLGLSFSEVAGVGEQIGWAAAPGPWIGHTLATLALAKSGSKDQQAKWLPALAAGQITGTVAFSESGLWRAEDWALAAQPKLVGSKDYVLGSDQADIAIIGLEGGRLGLVELGSPGVTRNPFFATDRTRPAGTLSFVGAGVDLLPGAYGPQLVDAAAVLLAADAHGGSRRMLEDVVEYNKTRVQFERVLASFQAIKHKFADMAAQIHPNRPLYRQAAADLDMESPALPLNASAAKALVTETFSSVARLCTEAYGGIGYTWEHSAHIWLRRAMFDYAWLGTPAVHRQRCVALLGWQK
jgi:alkylation response protein AidB-like acyl-CoA dehydrogenase